MNPALLFVGAIIFFLLLLSGCSAQPCASHRYPCVMEAW